MKKLFVYKDNSQWPKTTPIVFECVAVLQSEADKAYEEKFGTDLKKQFHIGCSVTALE